MKYSNSLIAIIVIGLIILLCLGFTLKSAEPMIVLSGSMVPIMMVGDIIIVNPVDINDIIVNDIIAFESSGSTITHRVMSITNKEELIFHTKGDANEGLDNFVVPGKDIKGKVIFTIPYLGYLPSIIKDSKLFIFLVIIPALLIITDELISIIKYSNPINYHKMEKENKKPPRKVLRKINWPMLYVFVIIGLSIAIALTMPYITMSEYSSTAITNYNITNTGLLTCSYTIIPLDIQNYTPVYGIIQPGNSSSIPFSEKLTYSISVCPIILPVFWVNIMSEISPVIPCLFAVIIFTMITTFISIPLWYKKPKYLNRKKIRK